MPAAEVVAVRYRVTLHTGSGGFSAALRRVAPETREPGLPLYVARWAEELVRQRGAGVAGPGWLGRQRWHRLWRMLELGLARLGYPGASAYVELAAPADPPLPDGSGAPERREAVERPVARLLAGRILLEEELCALAGRAGIGAQAALAAAEAMAQAGRLVRRAAVEVDGSGAVCVRCGSREGVVPDRCGRCGSPTCPRCTRCAGMGLARGCSALYAMPFSPPLGAAAGIGDVPSAGVQLGLAQQQAWEQLRQLVAARLGLAPSSGMPARQAPGGCLVWAVTGAGKTEVAFGAIQLALERGHPVLFAAPRREVAVDVALRARAVFGEERVKLLVGGRPDGSGTCGVPGSRRADRAWAVSGRLVVATTHQAVRFYQAFTLAVVDEADAFPFSGCRMLEYAVARAVRPEGFVAVMSATPGPQWLGRARAAGWPVILIPARHHGYPLPVPAVWVDRAMAAWEQEPDRPERVPQPLRRWLQQRRPGGRVLVFAPTVRLVEAAAAALGVPACHSRHPGREAAAAAFASGRIPVLVASPVLERGLTFDDVDVLVLFAHCEAIFDEGALVQMAGRCGRTARSPQGRVLFAASRLTRAIRAAVRHIRAMNRVAFEQGFLRESPRGRGPEVV